MTTKGTFDLDLDAEGAARREVEGGDAFRVRFAGDAWLLPRELPVDVFAPLRALDVETSLAVFLREAFDTATKSDDAAERLRATASMLDVLITRPTLPRELVVAIEGMLARLFCDEDEVPDIDEPHGADCQWRRFLKKRPTFPDMQALVRGLLAGYGVSLGEALRSTEPSANGGRTSRRTSSGTTGSTRARSGGGRARRTGS